MTFDPTAGIGSAILSRLDEHREEYEPRISLADEIAELRSQRKAELVETAMAGNGPFWSTDMHDPETWDNEQREAIAAAVGKIMRLPTVKAETRWLTLMAVVKDLVEHYAEVRTTE